MKLNIVNSISGMVGLKLRKYSPEILITVGVVGTVASTVLACRATKKLDSVLDDCGEQVKAVHDALENPDIPEEKYSEEDGNKDLIIIYTQTAVNVAKLYAPAVLLGVASLGCIITSHNILNKRNVALAAAYATIDTSFREYRKRVADRLGEETERAIRFDLKAEQVTETTTDENGKERKVKKTVDTVTEIPMYSDYARVFSNSTYYNQHDYNLLFIKQQQNFWNDMLKIKKFVFLNDVYESLGFKRTPEGQIVGWLYDDDNPVGDNYIDFGVFDTRKSSSVDFVNCETNDIILDFNVDGNIWDKI